MRDGVVCYVVTDSNKSPEPGPVDLVEVALGKPSKASPVDLVKVALDKPSESGPVDLVKVPLDESSPSIVMVDLIEVPLNARVPENTTTKFHSSVQSGWVRAKDRRMYTEGHKAPYWSMVTHARWDQVVYYVR